jgi:hypothetical protein
MGTTVVEGVKFTGEKLRESGRRPSLPRRAAGTAQRSAAAGQSVKKFFARLFSK